MTSSNPDQDNLFHVFPGCVKTVMKIRNAGLICLVGCFLFVCFLMDRTKHNTGEYLYLCVSVSLELCEWLRLKLTKVALTHIHLHKDSYDVPVPDFLFRRHKAYALKAFALIHGCHILWRSDLNSVSQVHALILLPCCDVSDWYLSLHHTVATALWVHGVSWQDLLFHTSLVFPVSARIGQVSFSEAKAPPTALNSELSGTPTFLSTNWDPDG